MNSLSTAFNGNGENCRHIEVAVGNTVTAYAVAFIGKLNMQGVLVCLRVNCYCADAHFTAGTDNSYCNFASVGNQNF